MKSSITETLNKDELFGAYSTQTRHNENALNKSAHNKVSHTKLVAKTFGYLVGGSAILFASLSFITNMQITDIISWMEKYFGVTFTALFACLVIISVFSIMKIHQQQAVTFWAQVCAQAANGISTLALTFTLLGISLGIGSLADQSLTPDNVNNVISVLTTQFSMAFMTTVVGLPTSTAVRAWLSILLAKQAVSTTNCVTPNRASSSETYRSAI